MAQSLTSCLTASFVMAALIAAPGATAVRAADESELRWQTQFAKTVQPFLKTYCNSCHGQDKPEAKLDLATIATADQVARNHATWQHVLERLAAKEMPPADAERQPTAPERRAAIVWIKGFRS